MNTSKKLMDEKEKALMARRIAIEGMTKNQYNRLRDYEKAHDVILTAEQITARYGGSHER